MNLQELKQKTPTDLLQFAEDLEIENASTLRKQDMLFAILKQLSANDVTITGTGVLEVLQDGFGVIWSWVLCCRCHPVHETGRETGCCSFDGHG